MISLRNIIMDIINESQHLSLNDIIIIGTIGYDDVVKSNKATNADANHLKMGFNRGINWRYNPIKQTVYWWDIDEANPYVKEEVENHLLKKYKFKVKSHLPMIIYTGNDQDDEIANYDHGLESHPWLRE